MGEAADKTGGICGRLAAARVKAFGARGRAAMARALGLSPSTYIYYEKNRMAPPDVLARAAQVAAVRLEWLVTGQEPRDVGAAQVHEEWARALPPELETVLARFREAAPGGASPATIQALAETLAAVRDRFPRPAPAWQTERVQKAETMIPILGRTAAGLVGRYEDLLGEEPAVTVADIARTALGLDVRRKNVAELETDEAALEGAIPQMSGGVALVQFDAPLGSGVIEFVDAPAIRRRFPTAFALRVDGESMKPRFRHGDIVIAAAGREVGAGQAALVQIRGRVGVTLKLVRRDGETVHLVPINERYETERLAAGEIEWLAPVLFVMRV